MLDQLSNLCLEHSETKKDGYTPEDMSNAMLIFMEIFHNIAHDYQRGKGLNDEQMALLAEEWGKNWHQTVLLGTGINLHDVYDK